MIRRASPRDAIAAQAPNESAARNGAWIPAWRGNDVKEASADVPHVNDVIPAKAGIQAPLRRGYAALFAACVLLAGTPCSAATPSYPTKPIRLVVPYPAGGGGDAGARIIGAALQERFGQPVVVDNRGGANTIVGSEYVANAPADGYTLLFCVSALASNASLYKTKYDPIKSFTPISLVLRSTMVLVVNPAFPARDVKELIALAKAKPGELTFSSFGAGSSAHLAGELLKSMAGVDMLHVPFKGGAQAVTEVIANRISMSFATLPSATPFMKSGQIRAIGVATAARNEMYKELPTVAESGLPGYEAQGWNGICGPAGVPKPIVTQIHAALADASARPETRARFQALGYEVMEPMSPEAFAGMIRENISKWQKVVKATGIKME
jgi:tripartite-type tricarboxylate transporter receptor subunit TctC